MKASRIKTCWSSCSGRSGAKRKSKDLSDEPRSKAKRKCSSKYYGVRLKRGLGKYVAELRVSEWKVVDKKIWLGTYEKEEGAARAVDLARKLLKCKKIRPFNLPCDELDNRAMSFQMPPNLILSDVNNQTMYVKVKDLLKSECRNYAASFESSELNPSHSTASAAEAQYCPVGLFSHEEVDMYSDSELSTLHTVSDSIVTSDQLYRTQLHSSKGRFQASGSNLEFSVDDCIGSFTPECTLYDQSLYDYPSSLAFTNTPQYNSGLQQEQQKQTLLGIDSNGVITPPALMTIPTLMTCAGVEESQEPDNTAILELIQQSNSPGPFTPPISDSFLCFIPPPGLHSHPPTHPPAQSRSITCILETDLLASKCHSYCTNWKIPYTLFSARNPSLCASFLWCRSALFSTFS